MEADFHLGYLCEFGAFLSLGYHAGTFMVSCVWNDQIAFQEGSNTRQAHTGSHLGGMMGSDGASIYSPEHQGSAPREMLSCPS